jgi:hypothetical protein
MTSWENTATIDGSPPAPPPGWGRWTDHVRARLRAHSIDEQLLNGGADASDPVIIVRRARLLGRRYRSHIATALRKLVLAAHHPPTIFRAKLLLRRNAVLAHGPLILTLADELEAEGRVSPRGVILADRLIRDGDSPVYAPLPVSRRYDQDLESSLTHARAALHLG